MTTNLAQNNRHSREQLKDTVTSRFRLWGYYMLLIWTVVSFRWHVLPLGVLTVLCRFWHCNRTLYTLTNRLCLRYSEKKYRWFVSRETVVMCARRIRKSACVSSHVSIYILFYIFFKIQILHMQIGKTLIRLRGCAGWLEFYKFACAIRYISTWRRSFVLRF